MQNLASKRRFFRNNLRNENEDNWRGRCDYWIESVDEPAKSQTSRRLREPLIITGHGARLWVNNGSLMIREGLTHYPQKTIEHRFFPNDPKRPSRIIVVDGSGGLSFSAMDWLARNEVPLVRINWRGDVQTVHGEMGYSANPKRVEGQRQAKLNGRSLEIGKALISEKIKNSISTLKTVLCRSRMRTDALAKLNTYLARVRVSRLRSISQLMGIEGIAAIAYFGAWQSLPIKWEGTKRKPIPDDWHLIGLRSSVTRQKTKNRNASHPVNAMLNYAYGVLESQIRIQIVANGYDPSIGFLHRAARDGSALVFDLMEPMRPVVDQVVLAFIKSHIFTPSDFIIRSDGVCRLHPSLAAAIVAMTAKVQNPNESVF